MYKFIWKITIKDSLKVEPFIENWRKASEVLQEYPGAKGTRLHRDIDDPNTFVAIAEWESKEARDAMEADRKAGSERGYRWQKYAKNEDYGQVEVVNRIELIEEVMPGDQ